MFPDTHWLYLQNWGTWLALVKNKETGNLPSRTCGRVHATTGELYKITEIWEHLSSSILPGSTLDKSDRIPSDIPEYRVHIFCHPSLSRDESAIFWNVYGSAWVALEWSSARWKVMLTCRFLRTNLLDRQHQSISWCLCRYTYTQHSKRVHIQLMQVLDKSINPARTETKMLWAKMYHAHFWANGILNTNC